MISISDSLQFAKLLKALSDDVVDAHIHYQFYLELSDEIDKHPLVVQQSNTFWTYVLQAHLNSCVFALSRAYDQENQALHLRSWLMTIEENLHLFNEDEFRKRLIKNPHIESLVQDFQKPDTTQLTNDIHLCSSYDPIVKKLVTYRGNRIAHRNAKLQIKPRKIDSNSQDLLFDDVKKLLDRSKEILNRYSNLFDASMYSTTVVSHDDFKYIFTSVEEKVIANRQQWTQMTKSLSHDL